MPFEEMTRPQLITLLIVYGAGTLASIGIFMAGCLKRMGVRIERPALIFATSDRAMAIGITIGAAVVLLDVLIRRGEFS